MGGTRNDVRATRPPVPSLTLGMTECCGSEQAAALHQNPIVMPVSRSPVLKSRLGSDESILSVE